MRKLEIESADFNKFMDDIIRGFGWITFDDIARQWQGIIGTELSEGALRDVQTLLDMRGLVRDRYHGCDGGSFVCR